jgi:hypothetical protein
MGDYLRRTDIVGYTPLHYAIISNNFKVARFLFKHKDAMTFYIKPSATKQPNPITDIIDFKSLGI